ncbi:BF3164 family lipoprotein [uncultured Roseivirga sp.]|uniref:BF3164 family lipoprotein n=1 Tax=uncultured Roseivirga sp. TaxID=543088 RepID=UPI000D7B8817|nr:BF3164 family lipoprotein [uncultured Roseivirga sp.]PWL31238.1 MAG: hypothetical protein DCO95_07120 [Roseivirga sp. XM-24bin3]
MNSSNLIKTLCVLIALTSLSCTRGQREAKIEISLEALEVEGRLLNAEALDISEEHLMMAFNLLVVGDKLVICKPFAQPNYFEVYNVKSLKYLGGFIKQGGGPGEFAGVLRSTIASQKEHRVGFIAKDMGRSYYEFDIDSALKKQGYLTKEIAELDVFGLNRTERNNQGEFVSLSLSSPNRIVVFDREGQNPRGHFKYPFQDEQSELRTEAFGMAYQAFMVRNFSDNRLGVFTMNMPNWDIISFNQPEPELVASHHLEMGQFKDLSEIKEKSRTYGVAYSSQNKEGFLDVTANDEYIYALYSGKNYERHGDDKGFSKKVVVLNWEGEIVDRLLLEHDTKIISVDQEGHYLYSIVEQLNKIEVVRYNLKSVID